MATDELRRLVLRSNDGSGAPVDAKVRVVPVSDGRAGCRADDELAERVDNDPRVSLVEGEATTRGTAVVVRSGRLYDEVHGRLRRARHLPVRTSSGPVLLIRLE
jgi:hypothetical protein